VSGQEDDRHDPLLEVVFAIAECGVTSGLTVVARGHGPQAQGFVDDTAEVSQLGDVVEFDVGKVGTGPVLVDFGVGFGGRFGVGGQIVQSERNGVG
jgi:hypothetical protein